MKTKRKTSGFFIVEILIVLIIVGILVLALLPNLTTYTQRAKFVDNLSAANGVRAAVDGCIIQRGVLADCDTGSYGIPTDVAASYGGYVNSLTVANGVITATSQASFGAGNNNAYTYILTPTIGTVAGGASVSWAASGNCQAAGLC